MIRINRLKFFSLSLGYSGTITGGGSVHSPSIRFRGMGLHVNDGFHGHFRAVRLRQGTSPCVSRSGLALRRQEGGLLRRLGGCNYVAHASCRRLAKGTGRRTITSLGLFLRRNVVHGCNDKGAIMCLGP